MITAVMACVSSCSPNGQEYKQREALALRMANVQRVEGLLAECPSWAGLQYRLDGNESEAEDNDKEFEAKRGMIHRCVDQICHFSYNEIREGVQLYLDSNQSAAHQSRLDRLSRVFILEKYLFNVPEKWIPYRKVDQRIIDIPPEWMHDDLRPDAFTLSYGWLGRPWNVYAKDVNLLWPWAFDKNGDLQIVEIYAGSRGPVVDPLVEFDHYHEVFGIRELRQ